MEVGKDCLQSYIELYTNRVRLALRAYMMASSQHDENWIGT